jgi:glycosyltransferase involved in cell wall biosynthesis
MNDAQSAERGISIILCCYNSGLRLPQTLKHLALQRLPTGIPWEIIVIDNASTDGTAVIARKEWSKYQVDGAGFTILSEPRPGKNYAFNTGLDAARFEYILTCDDDNWLNPDYLARAFQIMEADPAIGALGGCGIFEPELPSNPEISRFSHNFVNGPQTWADAEHWVYGAGSVYRKSALRKFMTRGWQQITSGRKGKSLICGEDVEFCFMIYLSGYKIAADEHLAFRHFVPLKRQTIGYIIDLFLWQHYSHVLMNSYYPILNQDKRPIEEIINKWLWGATKTYLKNLLWAAFKKLKIREQPTVEERIKFSGIHGTWLALLKNRKRIIDHHQQIKALLAGSDS